MRHPHRRKEFTAPRIVPMLVVCAILSTSLRSPLIDLLKCQTVQGSLGSHFPRPRVVDHASAPA